ncbi:TRAP transporter small permease [Roseobacter weihaiensis]|uniref:TRAP transporter small permease n=1 Tax=Roseobacter weihaiensis TaxID=2763262 RepID=UPI001D0B8404|nr:TRAP transporter small permease subunit [Roseobacter sp. H9]
MFEIIRRADAALRTAIEGASALLLLSVTCLGIWQVISRYVFNASLVWSEEAIRLLYVWLVLIAAATAPHMHITLFSGRLTGRAAQLLKTVQTLVMLALLLLLVQGAVALNGSFGSDRYVTLGLSKSWYWTAAIVGGLLWAGVLISGLIANLGRQGGAD